MMTTATTTTASLSSSVSLFHSKFDLFNSREINPYSFFEDDIDCKKWLDEVELPQYYHTFITNFSIGNNLLSRKRLESVRLQDFPTMNITDYEHAKILMDHIRITLQFSFDSNDRTREVRSALHRRQSLVLPPITTKRDVSTPLPQKLAEVNINLDQIKRKANHQRYISKHRRKAFDEKIWNSINKFREDNPTTIQNLRDGVFENNPLLLLSPSSKSTPQTKFMFDSDANNNTNTNSNISAVNQSIQSPGRSHQKGLPMSPRKLNGKEPISPQRMALSRAKDYGDTALDYDILLKQLKILQTEHLAQYRNLINCEVANIFFVNKKTRELMLFVNDKWFKMPIDMGIAGYAARTGESLNIPDAYADERFNRGMDMKTGFRTRNILCQPIRSNHGGEIVAVIQMLNKKGGDVFGSDDETIADTCVQKLAEDLEERFKDLLRLSDKMAGIILILDESN